MSFTWFFLFSLFFLLFKAFRAVGRRISVILVVAVHVGTQYAYARRAFARGALGAERRLSPKLATLTSNSTRGRAATIWFGAGGPYLQMQFRVVS